MGSVGGGKFRKIRYDVMGTNIYTLSGERVNFTQMQPLTKMQSEHEESDLCRQLNKRFLNKGKFRLKRHKRFILFWLFNQVFALQGIHSSFI